MNSNLEKRKKIFDEPQIFVMECLVTYKGNDYSDCDYPIYTIKAFSYADVFNKISDEINDYTSSYDQELYYYAEWEILSWKIDNNLTISDLDFDLSSNDLDNTLNSLI